VAARRLAGIRPPALGDAVLRDPVLPAFHARCAVPPALATSGDRPVPRDLDRVCAFHSPRTVAADTTVVIDRRVLQLQPGPRRRSYAKAVVEVVAGLDGAWRGYIHDRLVATTPAPPDAGQLRARRRRQEGKASTLTFSLSNDRHLRPPPATIRDHPGTLRCPDRPPDRPLPHLTPTVGPKRPPAMAGTMLT
jgi:hypothetical protein